MEPLKNDEMRGVGEERSKTYAAYDVEHRSQQRRSSRFSEVPYFLIKPVMIEPSVIFHSMTFVCRFPYNMMVAPGL